MAQSDKCEKQIEIDIMTVQTLLDLFIILSLDLRYYQNLAETFRSFYKFYVFHVFCALDTYQVQQVHFVGLILVMIQQYICCKV